MLDDKLLMLFSRRYDPRRWDADYSGTFDMPATEADAARYAAAQAKRDRKNAKRLRDAKGGPDA